MLPPEHAARPRHEATMADAAGRALHRGTAAEGAEEARRGIRGRRSLRGLRERGFLADGVRGHAASRRRGGSPCRSRSVRAVAPDSRGRRQADAGQGRARRDRASRPQALQKKLGALGRAHLATATLDAVDGPDRIYVESDGKADYVYLRSSGQGPSPRARPAGSARRRARQAADPEGDELRRARQLLQRREVRPARAQAGRAARRRRRPGDARSTSTPGA